MKMHEAKSRKILRIMYSGRAECVPSRQLDIWAGAGPLPVSPTKLADVGATAGKPEL